MINQATQKLNQLEHTWLDTSNQFKRFNTINETKILTKSQVNLFLRFVKQSYLKSNHFDFKDSEDFENSIESATELIQKHFTSNQFEVHNAYLCYPYDNKNHHPLARIRLLQSKDIPVIQKKLIQTLSINLNSGNSSYSFQLNLIKVVAYDIRKHQNLKLVANLSHVDSNILKFVVQHPHNSVIKALPFGDVIELLTYYRQKLQDTYEQNNELILNSHHKLVNKICLVL